MVEGDNKGFKRNSKFGAKMYETNYTYIKYNSTLDIT